MFVTFGNLINVFISEEIMIQVELSGQFVFKGMDFAIKWDDLILSLGNCAW